MYFFFQFHKTVVRYMVGEKMCQMLAHISLIIMLETTTEPSIWPQIPLIQRPPTSSLPATMMSQVDVPMIRVSIPGATDAPTAPIWASSAPTATAIPWGSPSLSAHSCVSSPALVSLVWVSVNRWGSISFKAGLSFSRTSPEGRHQQLVKKYILS